MGFLKLLRHTRNERESVLKTADSPTIVDVVTNYMNAINNHAGVEDLLSLYTSKKVKIEFEDDLRYTAQKSCEFLQTLYASFPDIRWEYKTIKEFSKNCVVVEEVCASGTHTGKPFQYKGRPEIPATGKPFQNDPALFYFTIVDNKIDVVKVVALGTKTGPFGIYEDLSTL